MHTDLKTFSKILRRLSLMLVIPAVVFGCGGGSDTANKDNTPPGMKAEPQEEVADAAQSPMDNKGVGPVEDVELGALDAAMAEEGKALFESYCTACHKMDVRYIGPALKDITTRRSPEWIMNMIMNPEVMVKEDPIAKELLAEYMSPMANQNITREQARSILEYFRSID